MYILVKKSEGNAYRDAETRRHLRGLLVEIRRDPRVGPVFAPFIARGAERAGITRWFQGQDERYTRAVFSVPLLETSETRALIAALDSAAAVASNDTLLIRATGPLNAGLPRLRALVDSQIRSLAVIVVVIAIALISATRSARLGMLLFVPNLLAPLAVAAAMGFLRIPLDLSTVVVFSIVLGVAVDDTLQLVWAGVPVGGGTFRGPLAVRRVAKPLTLTSLAAVLGFASMSLSPFPVTARLGGLIALGLIVAWLADLTVTPVLLARRPITVKRDRTV